MDNFNHPMVRFFASCFNSLTAVSKSFAVKV